MPPRRSTSAAARSGFASPIMSPGPVPRAGDRRGIRRGVGIGIRQRFRRRSLPAAIRSCSLEPTCPIPADVRTCRGTTHEIAWARGSAAGTPLEDIWRAWTTTGETSRTPDVRGIETIAHRPCWRSATGYSHRRRAAAVVFSTPLAPACCSDQASSPRCSPRSCQLRPPFLGAIHRRRCCTRRRSVRRRRGVSRRRAVDRREPSDAPRRSMDDVHGGRARPVGHGVAPCRSRARPGRRERRRGDAPDAALTQSRSSARAHPGLACGAGR